MAACLAAAAIAVPATAPAASVQVTTELPNWDNETALVFAAEAGENNRLTVGIAGRSDGYYTLEVLDGGAPLSVGEGCSGGGAAGSAAICRLHETVDHPVCMKGCVPPEKGENWSPSLRIELGNGDNAFLGSAFVGGDAIPMTVSSGPGSDRILSGDGNDAIDPGAGSDEVRTGGGGDRVVATAEPDGPDLYDMGADPVRFDVSGGDEVSYELRPERVEIVRGAGGASGEGDRLLDVERLVGGSGDDLLVGDAEKERLLGGAGADELRGGGERDHLAGGPGGDTLIGGPGRNYLVGNEDDDLLIGGTARDMIVEASQRPSGDDVARAGGGNDFVQLGSGDDLVAAGSGQDWVVANPGRDRVRCGSGFDVAGWLGADELRGCEIVNRG